MIVFSFFVLFFPKSVEYAMPKYEAPRTLLVYDSLTSTNREKESLYSFIRLLLSFGQQVTLHSLEEYPKGELKKGGYDSVVTYIQRPEAELQNKQFIKERDQFKGKKLHVGLGLTKFEEKQFSCDFVTLYEREYQIEQKEKQFYEKIGMIPKIRLAKNINSGQSIGKMVVNEGIKKKTVFPYAIVEQNNAYLPYYQHNGASLLETIELLSKWLNKKHKMYNPYITILGMNPLVDLEVAEEFQKETQNVENEFIISASSTDINNDLETFQDYIKILKQFTNNNRSIVYLNVPSLNSIGKNDATLFNRMEQEVSTLIENEIFPLGISAPDYWDFDSFYQKSALLFGDSVLLYPFDKQEVHHQINHTAYTFPLMFYCIDHKDLENIEWNINGKYTEFQFPIPVTISYNFPKTVKEGKKIIQEVLNDPFPPTDLYLYRYRTGITTQTQTIIGENGGIELNGVSVNNINFAAMKDRTKKIKQETKKIEKENKVHVNQTIMEQFDSILTIIILISLVIILLLFFIGKKRYRNMFIRKRRKK